MGGLPRLRVLGPLEVSVEGEVRAVGGRRARSVLAALVARHASFASIDVLVEDVWGDGPPPSARNALQTYVSRLRAVVAPCPILFRSDGYRLVTGADDLDALLFEDWCQEGRRALDRRAWDDAVAILDRAAGLWRGPAFAGLVEIGPAAGWARRLEDALVDAREGAARATLALGRADEAAARLEDVAEQQPWRERLWGLWALALYRQDRQAEALSVLGRLRRGLADELGLQPAADIEQLELAILRRDPGAALDPDAPPPSIVRAGGALRPGPATLDALSVPGVAAGGTAAEAVAVERPASVPQDLDALRGLRIVGRSRALRSLDGHWEQALDGRCPVVVVTGEAGIGKSRLAAELAHTVASAGGAVLYGRASERIDLAYQPFAQALRSVAPEALTAIGEAAEWLGAVRPTEPRPDTAVATMQGVDDRRARLFEAVGRLLEAVAAPAGLLLVIDDLHCATSPTLGLLEHLVTVTRPARLLVVATVRDTDLGDRPAVTAFLTDLRRRAGASTVTLDGLDVDGVDALLRVAGIPSSPDHVRRVWELTAGNPLLVTELARTFGVADTARSGLAGPAASDADRSRGLGSEHRVRTASVPDSVAELIADRARRLGDRGAVLSWAALIGLDFELEVVEAVAGVPDVLERLEEAVHAGLVREVGPGRWQFRHGLTAEALQAGLGPTRLAARHEAIADALTALLPDDVAAGRLAHHRCLAARPGRTTAAVDASLRAARLRLQQAAPAEALDLIGEGLAVLGLGGDADASPVHEAELHLAAGDAHQQLFDEPARMASAGAALAAARRSRSAVLLARAALLRSSFWTQGQTDPEATAALEEALSVLTASAMASDETGTDGGSARELRAQLLAHLAGSRAVSGSVSSDDTEGIVGQAEEAVGLARAGDGPYTRLLAESTLAITLYSGPWAARQLRLAEGMARGTGHLGPMCAARWAAPARLALGDRSGFEGDAAILCDDGGRYGVRSMQAFGLQCQALLALLDGRFDSAQGIADEAVGVGRGHENFTRVRLAQQFWVAAEQGTLASIEPVARALVDGGGPPVFEAMLGLVLCVTGGRDEAAEILADLARDDYARVSCDILWLATIAACAEIAAWVGDVDRAPRLEALLAPYRGQLVVVAGSAFVYGAVDRFRAMLASLSGGDDTVRRLFADAVGLEQKVGGGPAELRSRIWRCRLLGESTHEGDDVSGLIDQARRRGLGWVDEALPPTAGS